MARPRKLPPGKDRDSVDILSAELSPEAKGLLGQNHLSIAKWLRKVNLAGGIKRDPEEASGSVWLLTDGKAPARNLPSLPQESEFIPFLSGTALLTAAASQHPFHFKWHVRLAFANVRPRHPRLFHCRVIILHPPRSWSQEATLSFMTQLDRRLAGWGKPIRDLASMSRLKFRGLRFALDLRLSKTLSSLCAHMNGVLGAQDVTDVLSGKRISIVGAEYPLRFSLKDRSTTPSTIRQVRELLSPKGIRHLLAILDRANGPSGELDWQMEVHLSWLGIQRDAKRRAINAFKKEDREASANFVTLLSTLEFEMPAFSWKGRVLQGDWDIPGKVWRGRLSPDLILGSRLVRMPRLPLLLNHKDHGLALWLITQLHFTTEKRMQISMKDLLTKFGRNLHDRRERWEATLERELAYLRALGALHFSKRKQGSSTMLTISASPADYFPFHTETEVLDAERSRTEATLPTHRRLRAYNGRLNASDLAILTGPEGFATEEALAMRLGITPENLRKYVKDGKLPPSVKMTVRRDEELVSWLVQKAPS